MYQSGRWLSHLPISANNNHYLWPGSYAFRDAYFYRDEFSKADHWEWKVPGQSLNYINFNGCSDLVAAGEHTEALRTLYKIKAEDPWWPEPRNMLATHQLNLSRPALAKPDIDTALILEPYNLKFWLTLGRYYRTMKNHIEAVKTYEYAVQSGPIPTRRLKPIWPMPYILNNSPASLQKADSIVTNLIDTDPDFPDAYMLRGIILEKHRKFPEAVKAYGKIHESGSHPPGRSGYSHPFERNCHEIKRSRKEVEVSFLFIGTLEKANAPPPSTTAGDVGQRFLFSGFVEGEKL